MDKSVEKAISHIEKSLTDRLWKDAGHLAAAPQGKQVFHEEHKAVQQLKKIAQSKKISKDIKNAALDALQALLAADSAIADAALSEAGAYAGTSKKVDHFIQKSKKNLQKAERLRQRGQYARAIKCFEKAWHHARLAIKHAGEEQPPVEPPTVNITAAPTSITQGESLTLSWSSTNAESVIVDNGIGQVAPSGSLAVSPTATTTYTITASNASGTATDAATISVLVPPTASISADRISIVLGESVTLAWTASNADTVTIDNGIGQVDPSGSITVSPGETTTYSITATNAAGSATDSVTISVILPPTVDISASPSSITLGEGTTLTWTSTSADTVTINNGIGAVDSSGSLIVSPSVTTTYIITATNSAESAQSSVTVTVVSNVAPLPEGSFSKQYQHLVPGDATIEAYDEKRFVVITGFVYGRGMVPLSGVTISLHNHPEDGTALSDEAGRFSIPADGGGLYTVVYEKEGYITAHRQVQTPWNDIVIVDDPTVLIQQDTKSTQVVFDGNSNTVTVHESTPVADEFGTRATEFDTPESMPALLPPTSAYTYCVDFTADEAGYIRFEKPIVIYVDNFLGFDVGEKVPFGCYDRKLGAWVAEDNGWVVMLLDTDSDGVVDALDSTGDGQPDDLNSNGTYSDEVTGLGDLGYGEGETYLRVELMHFTIGDLNFPSGVPGGATGPNPKGSPSMDCNLTKTTPCVTNANSYIAHRNRVFHEDIAIAGTDMTLHYTGDRVNGYLHHITVPASGDTVPDSLRSIIVKMEVAGRLYETTLPPLPNQSVEFLWDGRDFRGNFVAAGATAYISVGFEYQAVYFSTFSEMSRSFAQAGGAPTQVPTRDGWIIWKRWEKGMPVARGGIANGWSISAHHYLSSTKTPTLWKGDGTQLTEVKQDLIINTYAEDVSLSLPTGLAFGPDGSLYIADTYNNYIRKVTRDGVATVVAGTGTPGYSGDGGPATQAGLFQPWDVAVCEEGSVYIADTRNNCIRKVSPDGIITTVAGPGAYGFVGDGGPAVEAQLVKPQSVTLSTDGCIYVSDTMNGRVRKISPDGIITTIAGTSDPNYSGSQADGMPATEVRLWYPHGIAIATDGTIYFVEGWTHCVRKITPDGIITTVAGGSSNIGYLGDNGPATEAGLYAPRDVAVSPDGILYIADSEHHRIRKVVTDGTITTVAGTGMFGYSGDGDPASYAMLYRPRGVAVSPDGNLYIADTYNHKIRKVASSLGIYLMIVTQLLLSRSGSQEDCTIGILGWFGSGSGIMILRQGDGPQRIRFCLPVGMLICMVTV